MPVSIRLSADLARLAGRVRLQLALPEPATVAQLLADLEREEPHLASGLARAVPVVNGRHVARSAQLQDGAEVALLTPIAGG